MTHRAEDLASGDLTAHAQPRRDSREMRIKRIDGRRHRRMFDHDIATIPAVARRCAYMTHDAGHRRENTVERLAAAIARERLDIDPFMKVRATAAHAAKSARFR